MASETEPAQPAAYAGSWGNVPGANTFDWVFSNPFEKASAYIPEAQRVARIEDTRPIFVDNTNDRTLTYGQLRSDALALAGGLGRLQLDPRDTRALPRTSVCAAPTVAPVVLVQLPNGLQFATATLGVLAAGLTLTPVSPALTATELASVVRGCRPRVLITAVANRDVVRRAVAAQEDPAYAARVRVFTVNVATDTYPTVDSSSLREGEGEDWKQLLAGSAASRPASGYPVSHDQAANRTAVILWSSGTSGRPKGVLLSHNSLNFSTASLWESADFYGGRRQRWLGYVPFYHVFGLSNSFLLCICAGSTVYTMPAFKLDTMLAAIPARRITYLHMAPPVAVMLAKAPMVEPYARRDEATGRNAFSSVVAAVTGGAPLGHEVVVQVFLRLGFLIRMGYGLSETCSVTVQSGLDEAALNSYADDTGQAHWGVELMIAASSSEDGAGSEETTKAALVGETGEVLVRSPGLLSAYIPAQGINWDKKGDEETTPDMATTTEALTPDGWFRTGDVGNIDEAGRLRITDRLKEMIKVRAFQVAPAELEATLCGSPEVADAGVVGVTDATEATEWPRAFVVPAAAASQTDADLQALASRLRDRVETHTARYKWLVGGIVFVKQIPKSPSGKILRRELRDGKAEVVLALDVYKRKKRPTGDSRL